MDEVDELMKKVNEEIRLEKLTGSVKVVATAPSRFTEREDILLADKFHKLFNKPHVEHIKPSNEVSLDDLQKRLNNLQMDNPVSVKIDTVQSTRSGKEEKKSIPPTDDPELQALWSKFNLGNTDVSDDVSLDFSENDEDDLDFIIQSCFIDED